MAVEDLDTVFFHQPADAALQLRRHVAGAFDDGLQVRFGLAHVNAKAFGIADQAQDVGAAQQGFGGDAAPVQADPAQVGLFDQRRAQAQLAGPDRRDVTAGAAAHHDHVESVIAHGDSLKSACPAGFPSGP